MFGVANLVGKPICSSVCISNSARGYATLKVISMRLKSVKNIQKITKSMKMVSAAKFAKAEKDLRIARPYGAALSEFDSKVEVVDKDNKQAAAVVPANVKKHLIIAVSSDRGLCGAIHTSIVKAVKSLLAEKKAVAAGLETRIVPVGDKAKQILQRTHASQILFSVNDVGKKNIAFLDAACIAIEVLKSGFEFDSGELLYNRFKSVISYNTTRQPFYSSDLINGAKNIGLYDSLDGETLKCYQEYQLASLIYYGLKENTASEQSAKMTAMENATKNAGEVIQRLTLHYNRTRQAVITRELIEIISGAAALEVKE